MRGLAQVAALAGLLLFGACSTLPHIRPDRSHDDGLLRGGIHSDQSIEETNS